MKGYKVVCEDQFPVYCQTWNKAMAVGEGFAHNTKKDAKIYEINEDGPRWIRTCKGRKART